MSGEKGTAIIEGGMNRNQMIELALTKGASLESLERLFALHREHEANEARKAYHEAMASFTANAPVIDKDRTVAYGTTKYTHASLANITNKIRAELSKWGLSATWRSSQSADKITITCKITHKLGHFEETSLSAPSDNSGQKNVIQAIGSTMTYLERYTLLAMTGLATTEQDDDGAGADAEYITEEQLKVLKKNITEVGAKMESVLAFAKVSKLELIPRTDFMRVVAAIEEKRKKA